MTELTRRSPRQLDSALNLDLPVRSADATLDQIIELPRTLPVIGTTTASGGDGAFEMSRKIVDYVRRAPALAHVSAAFAVYMVGATMSPKFDEGDLIFINPSRPARIGDYVLCELHAEGASPGPAYIKKLVRRDSTGVILEQFNPPAMVPVGAASIKRLYRVMPYAELFAV